MVKSDVARLTALQAFADGPADPQLSRRWKRLTVVGDPPLVAQKSNVGRPRRRCESLIVDKDGPLKSEAVLEAAPLESASVGRPQKLRRLICKTQWQGTPYGSHPALWTKGKNGPKPTKKLNQRSRRGKSLPLRSWRDIPEPEVFSEMTFTEEFTRCLFDGLAGQGLHLQRLASNMAALGTLEGDTITVRMGTVCSGSELLLTCLPHLCSCFKQQTGLTLHFDHRWACEKDDRKCQWIAANFPSLPTIFTDITKMADAGGGIDFVSGQKVTPEKVDVVFGGTSCRDASRMNKYQQHRRDSIATKSHTTGSTFSGFLDCLAVTEARIVILENVPALMDKPKQKVMAKSNFDAVKDCLNSRGFAFVHSILDAAERVHICHRRSRLWMAGCLVNGDPLDFEADFQTQVDEFMLFTTTHTADYMKAWALEDFLLDDVKDISDFKTQWMPELVSDASSEAEDDDVDSDIVRKGWFDKHQVLWWRMTPAERSAAWQRVRAIPLLTTIPLRQRELLALKYHSAAKGTDEVVWDLGQNLGRVPEGTGLIPCSMPGGRPWLAKRERPLLGLEGLFLQGCDPRFFPALRPGCWPNTFLQDLSGNAFCGTVGLAWLAAAVSGTPVASESV